MARVALSLVSPMAVLGGPSGHVYYKLPSSEIEEYSYYVHWQEMPSHHDLYGSFEFYWPGTTGYMGSQFHSDGTQMLDFAIWDADSVPGTAHPSGTYCSRFGGEGNGAHCEMTVKMEIGQHYRFRLFKSDQTSSGSTWSVEFNGEHLGSIFFDEEAAGFSLDKMKSGGVGFQEYYADRSASFKASIGFIGPYGLVNGEQILATSATCRCDAGTSCSDTIDGVGSGAPNVLLYGGPGVPTGSGDIWHSSGGARSIEPPQALGNFTILGVAKPGPRPSHRAIPYPALLSEDAIV